MRYCKRLHDLRIDNDLRQEDVAKVLNTTKQSYGMYENGKRKLSIEDLIKLAEFYKVSTDYILALTSNPKTHWNTKNNNITFNGNVTINGGKNKINIE